MDKETRLYRKHVIADGLELAAHHASLNSRDPKWDAEHQREWHRKFLMWSNEADRVRAE
ncbi:hypothetical protein [Yoonia sp.]|uniref:hypothetical protein n=1 Tax=Yoonia sp. TaxID=2212373 RepID=UPI002E0ACD65|nr:hypothetical protein [Yoonia sp.]